MKSIKKNYFFSILKSIMSFLFPLISFPYASRVLGVSNLGIVTYCTTAISYFTLFASLGIVIYATREGAKIREDKGALSKFSQEIFIINLISTVIVYSAFLVVLFFFTENKYFLVMLISSLAIWFNLLSVEWLYQIEEEFSYISIRSMIFQAAALVLLLLIVKTRDDYVRYAVVQVFASGGSCVLNIINSRKYVSWKNRYKLELKKHLKPIFTIFGISAATSIYINLDTVMLKWIQSEYEVGLYATAVKMNTLVTNVINSLSVILLSRLSNYVNGKKDDQYETLLKKGFSINLSVAVPCAVGLFMISEYIILLFSGEEYIGAVGASKILAINLVFAIIDGMIYYQILIPNGMEAFACIGTSLGALANILLNVMLIPKYSIEGAAVATVLSEMLVMISFTFFLRNKVKVWRLLDEFPRVFVASLSIVIICAIITHYVKSRIWGTLLSVSLSALAYMIVLKLLRGVFAEEMFRLLRGFWEKFKKQK